LGSETNTLQLSARAYIHLFASHQPLIYHFTTSSQKSRNQVWYLTVVLKAKTNSQRTDQTTTVLFRFFHETCQFFKGFERTGTCDSWSLKHWKNRNWRFFKNSKNRPTLVLLSTFVHFWVEKELNQSNWSARLFERRERRTIAGRQRVVVGVCAATRDRERVGERDTAQRYGGYGQSCARRRRYIIPFFLPIPACRAPSSHPMLRRSRPPSACSCCSHPVFSYSLPLPSSSSS
jgi:hypothetical protein